MIFIMPTLHYVLLILIKSPVSFEMWETLSDTDDLRGIHYDFTLSNYVFLLL